MEQLKIKDKQTILNAVTKLRPKNGDVILLHVKTDEYGSFLYSVDQVKEVVDQICKALNKMGINGAAIAFPDKICLNSVKNVDDTIRDLQNIIDYVREAKELIGGAKKQKSEEPAIIDIDKLMKNMSFEGKEETQV